jgi:hypothetical protein
VYQREIRVFEKVLADEERGTAKAAKDNHSSNNINNGFIVVFWRFRLHEGFIVYRHLVLSGLKFS